MHSVRVLSRRAGYLLALGLVFASQAVEACPGCKQAVGGDGAGGSHQVNGIALGYAISIGLMLFMLASLIGGLGYMMYRNCRILAASQQPDLEEGYGPGSRLSAGLSA